VTATPNRMLRTALALATLAGQSACLVEFPERGPERDEDNAFVHPGPDALSGAAPGEVPSEGPPATPPDPEGVAPPEGPPTKPAPDTPDVPDAPDPDAPDAPDGAEPPDPGGCVEGLCARCEAGVRVVPVDEQGCRQQDCGPFPAIEQGVDDAGIAFCQIRATRLIGPCQEFAVCAVAGPRTCAANPDPASLHSVVAPSPCYVIDGCVPGGNPVPRAVAGLACPGGTCDGNGVCVASPAAGDCAGVDVPESGQLCGAAEQPGDACRFLVSATPDQNQARHWDNGGDDDGPGDAAWPAVHCGNFCRSLGRACVRVLENAGGACGAGGRCITLNDVSDGACCEIPFFANNPLDGLDVRDGGLCDCR
jgi:hypothetical protein